MWRAIFAGILASMSVYCGAAAATFNTVDSGNNGELLTSLPNDDQWYVLYSVDVGSLSKGDILTVKADAELTNHGSTNVGLSSKLILADGPTDTSGISLDNGTLFYVEPTVLHGVPYKQAIHYMANSTTKHYVNLLVAAQNGMLTVEQDCGRLQVLIIHTLP